MQSEQSSSGYLLPAYRKETNGDKKVTAWRDRTALSDALQFKGIGCIDRRRIVFWDASSRKRIAAARIVLEVHLRPLMSRLCTHTKGHCGVKCASPQGTYPPAL